MESLNLYEIILTIFRIGSALVFVFFYTQTKQTRFVFMIIGWMLYSLSPLASLNQDSFPLLRLFYYLNTPLSICCLAFGISLNSYKIKYRYFILINLTVLAAGCSLWFFSEYLVFFYSRTYLAAIMVYCLIFGIKSRRFFQKTAPLTFPIVLIIFTLAVTHIFITLLTQKVIAYLPLLIVINLNFISLFLFVYIESNILNVRLRESYQQYKELHNKLPYAIALVRGDTIIYTNEKAVTQLVDCLACSPLGRSFVSFIPDQLRKDFSLSLKNVLSRGDPISQAHTQLLLSSSDTIDIEYSADFILVENIPAVQIIFRDVTEQIANQNKLTEQAQFTNSIIDTANVIILVLDKDANILLANDFTCTALGYAKEEVVGQNWFKLAIPNSDQARIQNVFADVWNKTDYHWGNENEVTCQDGSRKVFSWQNSILKTSAGATKAVIAIGSDITEQKKQKREISKRKKRLRAIYNAAINTGFILTRSDPENPKIIEFSPGAENIFQYSFADLKGKPVYLLWGEGQQQKIHEIFKMVQREGKDFQGEVRLVRKDQGVFPALLRVYPVSEQTDSITSVLCVVIDLSEKHKLEEMLRISEKMQAIGQLAGGIAHDFNNQLAIIAGYAELLAERLSSNAELDEYVSMIRKSCAHSVNLTGQLLAFARKGKYQHEIFDIHSLIEETLSLFKGSADKRITVTADLACHNSLIEGDKSQVENALLNLLLNARDALPTGGTITVATSNTILKQSTSHHFEVFPGKYVCVTVKDSGPGIEDSIKNNIFEPFFTTKPEGKGTGMGLAAVYGTIKNHKGYIDFNTSPQGSSFVIFLPYVEHEQPHRDPTGTAAPAITDSEILVIDDETNIRQVIKKILEREKIKVIAFGSCREAIGYFRLNSHRLACVILDLIMPDMNGREVLAQLRRVDPRISVIICSGYSMDESVLSLLTDPNNKFLKKPFTRDDLIDSLNQAMGRAEPQQG